jgi:CheY-like chemotaxis protein
MLEHDDDDRYITQTVFDENDYPVKLYFVNNSEDLFAFLLSCEKTFTTFPAMILLNHYASPLNAVEIIRRLKSNLRYAHIPVVVLSGTTNADMLHKCYAAGANSFIKKPATGSEVNTKITNFIRYWFGTVELP